MEKELISIVIPVYNRIKYLSKAIESAQNQTYKNIEIIIVDNKSTDGSWELINEFAENDKRIRIFQNEENVGPVKNWQFGFSKVKGDYIKILWSDDWMDKSFLNDAIEIFDEKTAFVLSNYAIVNNDVIRFKTSFNALYSNVDYLFDILIYNKHSFPFSPGAALFRTRNILESFFSEPIPNMNNFDSQKNGAGNDLLLYLQIANKYSFIKTTCNLSNFFREHPNSFSSANNIHLYYDWAKLFFIKQNMFSYKESNFLKIQLLKKLINNSDYYSIYNSCKFEIRSVLDFFDIAKFSVNRLFFKR